MTGKRTSLAKKPLRRTPLHRTRGKSVTTRTTGRSAKTPKPCPPKTSPGEEPAQEDPNGPETIEEIILETDDNPRTMDETEDYMGDVVVVELDDDENPIETPAVEEISDRKPTQHAERRAARATRANPPSLNSSVSVAAITKIIRQLKPDNRKLPKFSGDVLEWPQFIKKYRRTTRELQLDNEENRERLEGALRGRAKRLVRDKLQDACLVERAIVTLEQEYGGTQNLMKAALERVRKVKRLDADLRHINKFVRDSLKIELIVRECHSNGMEGALLNLMVDLLPGNAVGEWRSFQREIKKSNRGNFSDFVNCKQRLETDYTRGQEDRSPSPEIDQDKKMYRPLSTWQRTTQRNWTPPRNGSPHRHRTPPRVMHTRNRYSRYPDESPAREDGRPRGTYAPPRDQSARYQNAGYAQRRSRSRTPPRLMHTRRHNGLPAIEPDSKFHRNNRPTSDRGPARRKTPPATNEDRNCHMDCPSLHPLADCPKYKSLSDREKYMVRRIQKRCHYCLLGHLTRDCPELRP